MSYDIFFVKFQSGEPVDIDRRAFDATVRPFVVSVQSEFGFLGLRTSDGNEADVYATGSSDVTLRSFSFRHFGGGEMLDLFVELARATETVILPPGCPTLVTGWEQAAELPEEFAVDVRLIATGSDIEEVFRTC